MCCTLPVLAQGVLRGRGCSGSIEHTPGTEQAQQDTPGSCGQGPMLCWRKEHLLLCGVINHLKRVMTGTKDGTVPQPLPPREIVHGPSSRSGLSQGFAGAEGEGNMILIISGFFKNWHSPMCTFSVIPSQTITPEPQTHTSAGRAALTLHCQVGLSTQTESPAARLA